MKIPMAQAIAAIYKEPDFMKVYSAHTIAIANNAIKIRKRCLDLVKNGNLCLVSLSEQLGVHRATVIGYLKEMSANGDIEFTTDGGAKIIGIIDK